MKHTTALRPLFAIAAAAVALAPLAACERKAADEYADASAIGPEAIDYAPPVDALPPGPAVRVGAPPQEAYYGWAENARYLNYAFADGPPDYAYPYDDYEVWGWESEDGWLRVVEPLSDGERYYYYRPGADFPFFVIDDGYGYGFDDGVLMVVYDPDGRTMPSSFLTTRTDWAGRYLRRGRELERAREVARRRDVDDIVWSRRQARLAAEEARLERTALQQPAWNDLRRRAERAAERRPLEAERQRRLTRRAERQGARARAEAVDGLAPPPVGVERPRRDDNPGVAKRSPKADEAHARNEARKAAREEARRDKGKGRDDDDRERD